MSEQPRPPTHRPHQNTRIQRAPARVASPYTRRTGRWHVTSSSEWRDGTIAMAARGWVGGVRDRPAAWRRARPRHRTPPQTAVHRADTWSGRRVAPISATAEAAPRLVLGGWGDCQGVPVSRAAERRAAASLGQLARGDFAAEAILRA
jgi:hypothetical protein